MGDYKIIFFFDNIDNSFDPLLQRGSIKIYVRDYSIKYAKQPKCNVKHSIKIIEKKIEYIENLPRSEINMNEKRQSEQELDNIYDNISKGAQIR